MPQHPYPPPRRSSGAYGCLIAGGVAIGLALVAILFILMALPFTAKKQTPSAASASASQPTIGRQLATLDLGVTSNPGPVGKPVAVSVKVKNITPPKESGFRFSVRADSDDLEPTRILGGVEENAFGRTHGCRCNALAASDGTMTCTVLFTPRRFGRYEVRVRVFDLFTPAGAALEETVDVTVRGL